MKIFIAGDIKEKNKNEAPVIVGDYLFRYLLKKNIDTYYLTYFKEGNRFSRKQKLFGYEQLSERTIRGGIFPLLKYIIKNKPDIIHLINVEFFYILFYLLKPLLNFKVVYTVHGIVKYETENFRNHSLGFQLRGRFIEWMNFRFADKIIFLSDKTSNLADGVKSAKKAVLDNGIEISEFKKNYCSNDSAPFNKIAFVVNEYNGERKEKGLDLLVSYLQKEKGNFVINLYGSRETRTLVSGNVSVNYNPFLDDNELSLEMLKNDFFAAPSRMDTFNLSLLKAMDLGMLFLCTDMVGLSERFDDKLKAFVYRFDGYDDFHLKFKLLCELSDSEKEEYSNHIKMFAQNFAWEKVINEYILLYKSLLT